MRADEPYLSDGSPNLRKPHLSWSQVSQYNLCPLAYRFQRIDKIPSPTSPAAYVGKRLHAAAEYNFRQKITSGNDLAVDEICDYFVQNFDKNPENESVNWRDESIVGVRDTGAGAMRQFMGELAPRIQPAAIEEWWEISIGDSCPFTLMGIYDIRTVDDRILDNKFFSRMKSQADVDKDGQLDCYSLAYRLRFKREEKGLGFAIATRAHRPQAKLIETTRTTEQLLWRMSQIEEVAAAVVARIFPRRDDTWKHSEKWCEYWGRCVGGKSKEDRP